MAAANTDKLRKKKSNFSTTLNGNHDATTTTIALNSTSGLPTDTAITLTIDRVDANGVSTPTAKERVTGVVSGNNLTNCLRGEDGDGGTGKAHTSGAVVEDIWDADTWNDHIDHHLVEHNQDGTHKSALVTTLKASGAEVTTGTNDVKIVTPKALADAGVIAPPVKASGAEINTGTNDTKFATPKAIADSNLLFSGDVPGSDGWMPVTDSWAYASANTITVPSGAASRYQKGDRIKFTQTTVKYGVIIAVADTLLTIAINTDYVVANAAISDIYYSHQANPLGYPSFFNFAVGNAAWDGTPPTTPTTLAKLSVLGNICTVELRISYGSAGSGNSQFNFDAPIAVLNGQASKFFSTFNCYMSDNAFSGAPISYQTWGGNYGTNKLYINHNGAAIAANAVAMFGSYEI